MNDDKKLLSDLNEFDIFVLKQLQITFSAGITRRELLSVATVISLFVRLPPISHEAKRTFVPLIKWFSSNYYQIAPILPYIQLVDQEGNQISLKVQCTSQ